MISAQQENKAKVKFKPRGSEQSMQSELSEWGTALPFLHPANFCHNPQYPCLQAVRWQGFISEDQLPPLSSCQTLVTQRDIKHTDNHQNNFKVN